MPKTVTFEGRTHVFPDDFTDQDIQRALASLPASSPAPAQPRTPVAGRGTQFSQQRAQRIATENLPTAGSFAGGALGSLLGPGGTIAGTGFGGMLGQGAQDALKGREPDAGRIIERGLQDTALSAAGPLVGGGLRLGGRALTNWEPPSCRAP